MLPHLPPRPRPLALLARLPARLPRWPGRLLLLQLWALPLPLWLMARLLARLLARLPRWVGRLPPLQLRALPLWLLVHTVRPLLLRLPVAACCSFSFWHRPLGPLALAMAC